MFKEFKKFAVKGNVIDLAVGIIIGGAFGKIVTSLVNDIIMPPIGAILAGVDFSKLSIVLKAATENKPAVSFNYGNFINAIIDFLIISLAVFVMVKQINKFKQKEETKKSEDSEELKVLKEIRDSLKNEKK